MLFGNPELFAIESEVTRVCDYPSGDGRFALGRLRLWLGGHSIGSFSEEMLNLRVTTGALRDAVTSADPEDAEAGRMIAAELLKTYQEVVYGDRYEPASYARWAKHRWIWGAPGFESVRSLRFRVNSDHRIIWQDDSDERPHEVMLDRDDYAKAVADLFAWYHVKVDGTPRT